MKKLRVRMSCLGLGILTALSHPGRSQTFADTGFVSETVATLPPNQPVGMTWAPDGSLYIWQDNGMVRVVRNGVLLPEPFIDIGKRVNTVSDRGMLGLALDPDFADNGYVYLLYTYEEGGNSNDPKPKTSRLTRVTADPGNRAVAVPNSEVVILGKEGKPPCRDLPEGSDCIGSDSHSHSIGTLRFGKDGKLLVSIGDGAGYDGVDTLALRSQDLNRYEGKILRINTDGSAPGDNPFDDGKPSIRSKVYAYGLRNPYRFGIEPSTGEIYIGDVGWNSFEEINRGRGLNFGWPCFEGKDLQPKYQDRFDQCRRLNRDSVTFGIHTYTGPQGHSAIGGAFYSAATYPAKYRGNFFFADYTADVIRRMSFDGSRQVSEVLPFLSKAGGPVSMELGPDGFLYYIAMNVGEVRRIALATGAPVVVAAAKPISGPSPLSVAFSSEGTVDPQGLPLTYLWDFGDSATSTDANPAHVFTAEGARTFKVVLTATNSRSQRAIDTLSVTVGSSPPVAKVLEPADGMTALPGDTVGFEGTASDPDQSLPPEAFAWTLLLHHESHIHPFGSFSGPKGSFVVESHGDGTYKYELLLSVTDKTGLKDSRSVMISIAPPVNQPPKVSAGPDQSLVLPAEALLQGSVSDDGWPKPPGSVTLKWSLSKGPADAAVVFSEAGNLKSTARFSKPGDYALKLAAWDGLSGDSDEVMVKVGPEPPKKGLNGDAKQHVDLDAATAPVDTSRTVRTGVEFQLAVRISEAVRLRAYAFHLDFDTSGLLFVKAAGGDSGLGMGNFLAGSGKSPTFDMNGSGDGNDGRVSIAASLRPEDSALSPSGAGIMALVRFKARRAGRWSVSIRDMLLTDWEGRTNVPGTVPSASLKVEDPPTRLAAFPGPSPGQALGGLILPGTRYRLSLRDIRGGLIYRAEGQGATLQDHLREAMAGRAPSGLRIVSLEVSGKAVPLSWIWGPALR